MVIKNWGFLLLYIIKHTPFTKKTLYGFFPIYVTAWVNITSGRASIVADIQLHYPVIGTESLCFKTSAAQIWSTLFHGVMNEFFLKKRCLIFETLYCYKVLLALKCILGDGQRWPISCAEYTTPGLGLKIFSHFHATTEPKEAASTYCEEMKCWRLSPQCTATVFYAPINGTGFGISGEEVSNQKAVWSSFL